MINFAIFSMILLFLTVGGYFLNKGNIIIYDFFDFNHTTILRGIGISLVLWGHVGKVNNIGGIQFIAGAGVSLFLICSGYGLEISYKKTGLNKFWTKKIINVIIPFYVISIVGYVISSFNSISLKGVLNIFTLKSQWYINYLLICYVIFWMITTVFMKHKKRMVSLLVVFIIWFFIDSLFYASIDAPFLRARQMGAFITGIAIANNKEKSKEKIGKFLFLVINLIIGLALMVITNTDFVKSYPVLIGNVLSLGTVVPLAFSIISASVLWKRLFANSFFVFVGAISYEIFLVHSYTLRLSNRELYFVPVFIVFVLGLSWVLNKSWKMIKKKMIG